MKQIDKFKAQSALFGTNAGYVEDLFEAYLADPNSIEGDWRAYFDSFEKADRIEVAHGPIKASFEQLGKTTHRVSSNNGALDHVASEKQAAVLRLISAYRIRGHQEADLCPLHLRDRKVIPELTPEFHGLSSVDLDAEFNSGTLTPIPRMKLSQILEVLKRTYTRHIGAEFFHITNTEERNWIQNHLESTGNQISYNAEQQKTILKQLIAAEGLERYLHTRYVGQKRFSLEGGDALIPMMNELVERAGTHGAQEIVIGMAHRGRLNMLVNILGKAPSDLFAEFEGKRTVAQGAGDVKYHMGFSSRVQTTAGPVHLALAFNPSHLEIVNPVVEGSVRARLERRRREPTTLPFNEVVPVLIHGDAAFAGQGVVMETMQFSGVRGYRCGGTIHLVINNQIGFTTSNPLDTRSASYCTDVAKMIQAPIFHVNGDDPEAVKFITQMAMDYRQEFGKDVVIDLVCYRRLGHNEADEPSATQPMMYQKIRAHDTPALVYANHLIAQNVITMNEYTQWTSEYKKRLEDGKPVGMPLLAPTQSKYIVEWGRFLANQSKFATKEAKLPDTTVSLDTIMSLSEKMNQLPDGLILHPRVQKIHDDRHKMGSGAQAIDWGYAEIMAYATLLEEGYPVRISGQDCGRGTFFHRHAVYHGQTDGVGYSPLANLSPDQAQFVVIDSILSEEAVLGFEYGYATAEPNSLVIWEGQFGDFVNGAQVVIDQFITSGETKWGRLCGLVLLLPHGYEGQGPEHSSGRPERFLQLCSENNMSVVVPSTPAQCFHMLRRQILQDYRKPLVCMSPKSLLRHKLAVNSLEDLSTGGFMPVIEDSEKLDTKKVERLIISVGKVCYDLIEARQESGDTKTALVRLEEIYPFPEEKMAKILKTYPNAKDIVFCQDEPKNQGYWFFVRDYLDGLLPKGAKLRFAGRPSSASPAVGYNSVHVEQQKALIADAFGL